MPEKKLIYIDPPKTGSTSLDNYFKRHCKGRHIKYHPSVQKHMREIPDEFSDFDVVASVRNPYTRLFSLYKMDIRLKLSWHGVRLDNFDNYAQDVLNVCKSHSSDNHDQSVYRYFSCSKYLEIFQLKEFIRMEEMVLDLQKLGFNASPSKQNSGNYKETWLDNARPDTIAIINEWAGEDFQLYGYERRNA